MATAKKLPSGSWRCLIYTGNDKNGKRQYKSFTAATKREAEYLATQYMVSLEEHKKQKKSDALFSDALSQYIASKTPVLSPSTEIRYDTPPPTSVQHPRSGRGFCRPT